MPVPTAPRPLASLAFVAFILSGAPALAQALVATVNDSPITNVDLEQRMKLLRAIKKPATKDAALESIYEARLKLAETAKFGVKPSDQDAAGEVQRIAQEQKAQPRALLAAVQASGADRATITEYFGASYAWRSLVAALNKNVGVPERDVRAELGKQSARGRSEYRLRQVLFVIPASASDGVAETRMRMAQQLRTRFQDCQSGITMARAMDEVVVREATTRDVTTLNDDLLELIDKTPVGHLTPPQRGAQGIEMIAVCSKSDAGSDSAAADNVRQTMVSRRLEDAAAKLYKPLRDRAVIVQR